MNVSNPNDEAAREVYSADARALADRSVRGGGEEEEEREYDVESGKISEPPDPPSRGRYGGTGVGCYVIDGNGDPPRYLGSYGTKGVEAGGAGRLKNAATRRTP